MTLKPYASLAGCFTAVLLTASTTYAAEDDERLTIVITGSRTAQTVDETLAPVTVIDREQIAKRPNATVTDLLRLTPGLTVVSNGGRGAQTSIFLRGTESDHVLILIDGVRVGSATSGTAAIQDIPPDQIERIEIVRGPQSSLYGSDAIGGVIQFFTRKPDGDTRANFSISGGSHSSSGLNAGLSGRRNSAWYNANISTFKTDGFDACRGKPFPDGGGCFTVEPDDDGYKNDSITLAGGVQLGPRVNASLNALHIDSELEFDGSFENEKESINQVLGGKLEIVASDIWSIDLLVAKTKDHSDNFKDGVFSSRFDTDRDQLSFQNDILAGKTGVVTLGVDYYQDEVSGTTDYVIDSRDNTGIFGQYLGDLGSTNVQLSLRNDDNEQFGNETTGGASIGQDFADNMRWTASYGSAFKAPSFNELYFPGFGNPNLSAETSDSVNLGLSGKSQYMHYSANLFDTKIDNLITFDAAIGRPVNIGEAHISGLELVAGTQLSEWNINAAYTLISPENKSTGPNQGNNLARRPEQSFDLSFARPFGRLNMLVDVHSQGHSYDDLANTNRLAGFATVDLNLGYAVSQNWLINLALNNLLDKEYETAKYYNQDGINALLTLRYTPN
jgi:vitamin B12 transporter